jgi:hypothetical protein
VGTPAATEITRAHYDRLSREFTFRNVIGRSRKIPWIFNELAARKDDIFVMKIWSCAKTKNPGLAAGALHLCSG